MTACDAIVIGGGLVGGAVAFGLAREGARVTVFDEGDLAFRASRGNFGLVIVQGKGLGRPAYLRWTRLSADRWPDFAGELEERTGTDIGFRRRGVLRLCLSEEEWNDRVRLMEQLEVQSGNLGFDYEMLDREAVADMVPGIGAAVIGASHTPYDCECTPLGVLRALHGAIVGLGGRYVPGARVAAIEAAPHAFAVAAGGERARAPKLVLAAGLGSKPLAGQLGLAMPVAPERGQVIITERVRQSIPMPLGLIRQTAEGGFMLGRSAEHVGLDDRTTTEALGAIARSAIRTLPYLAGVRIVRAWGALRVMTPDAYPIYEQSVTYPGAFAATCHSGVTLAAAHAYDLAPAILAGALPSALDSFTGSRFALEPDAETWATSRLP